MSSKAKPILRTSPCKSGPTNIPANDETIRKLQAMLDVCRQQNALLRAQFNPERIRAELQREPIVNQDQNELYSTQIRELMEEIQTLKSGTNQYDSKELDLLKEKNKQLEKTLKEANEKLAQSDYRATVKISSRSASGEIMKLKSEMEAIKIKTNELDGEVQRLKAGQNNTSKNEEALQTQKLEADNKRITMELHESKKQESMIKELAGQSIQELETEKKGISEELQNKKTEIEKLQDQLKRLNDSATDKAGLEQLQREVGQLKQERDESRSSIEKLQDEKRKQESRIKELEGKCYDAFVDLERKGKEMKKVKYEHQVLIERKDKTIEELRRKGNMVDPRSPSSKIKEIEDERDELRKRLSEIVSAKMTTNNPDSADLSDEFRPNKLGEMYSELYDNEWTDAFEEVESARGSEKAAIEYLLKILQEANSFIQKAATQYWEQAIKAILSFNGQVSEIKEDQLPLTVQELLVDLRMKTSPYLKNIVGTVFVKQSKGQGEKEELFRRHCAELCWMMSMQDPPLVLGLSTLSGNFNTSLYKEYTKRGSTVDFIVWPPLHLHENGPILSKGVAQGK